MKLLAKDKKIAIKSLQSLKKLLSDSSEAAENLLNLEKLVDLAEVAAELNESSSQELPIPQKWINEFSYFCFSDGACRGNPGPGAWGSLIQEPDGRLVFESSDVEVPTTNNRMEMTGALRCLEFLIEQGKGSSKIIIISDSKYLVDGMNSWVAGWKKRGWKKADRKTPENVDLWQSLDEIRQSFREVQFSWVKGHAGHPQNERCDQLANEALDRAGH